MLKHKYVEEFVMREKEGQNTEITDATNPQIQI